MKNFDSDNTGSLEKILSQTVLAQEVIRLFTGILLVLLSIRGLLAFYGAKQETWLEQVIDFVTAPVVLPFRSLFTDSRAGEVPVFFSMLCVLSLGVLLYTIVDLVSKYSLLQKLQVRKSMLSTQKTQNQS